SLSGGFNNRSNDRREYIDIDQLTQQLTPVELSNRTNTNNRKGNNYDVSVDFSQKFKKPREELTFNFSYSKGDDENDQYITTNIFNQSGASVELPLGIEFNDGLGDQKNY